MTKEELFNIKNGGYSEDVYKEAAAEWDRIAKPLGGLGVFEPLICRIAAIQGESVPDISGKALIIMCADNGVTEEKVTQTDSSVTADVAELMTRDQSSVGVMCRDCSIDIYPVDIGIKEDISFPGLIGRKVRHGTENICKAPAMDEGDALAAIECGIDMVELAMEKGAGVICTGEMGIGNTTTSTAMLCALTGEDPEALTGRGAGIDDEGLRRKKDAIGKALELHGYGLGAHRNPDPAYALGVLQNLGGLDIAGLVGVYAGAYMHRLPVVIDGVISAVAALCASCIIPGCGQNMIASHTGRERGVKLVLERLKLHAVLDASMALGEGSGSVMLMPLLDMALNLYRYGTRFSDTDIQQYERIPLKG